MSSEVRVDVVIVTALDMELEALLRVTLGLLPGTTWIREEDNTGRALWFATFEHEGGGELRVVATCAGAMRETATAEAASALVERFSPRCVAMCGVLAGRPGKTRLGDVIIGSALWNYDQGKIQEQADGTVRVLGETKTPLLAFDWERRAREFKIDPGASWLGEMPIEFEQQRFWLLGALADNRNPLAEHERTTACPDWTQVVRSLRKEKLIEDKARGGLRLTKRGRRTVRSLRNDFPDGFERRRVPTIHVAPIATGRNVIEQRSIWLKLDSTMRDSLGLEMEAAAIGWVAHVHGNEGVRHLVMKSVMDSGEPGRTDDWKPFAARSSAESLIAFLRRHLQPAHLRPGHDDLLHPGMQEQQELERLPSSLLSARHGVIPFEDGSESRKAFSADFERWCMGEERVAVRLLYGDGGMGKTRFAIERCGRLRAQGWRAGFLLEAVPEDWLARLMEAKRNVLVVVDYAESRSDLRSSVLLPVMRFAATKPSVGVRLLLLARNAADWWAALRADGELASWLPAQTITIPPVAHDAASRQHEFERAATQFGKVLGKNAPVVAPIPLTDARFGRVLYLHMAALAAVEGIDFADAGGLLDATLNHEESLWRPRLTRGPTDDIDATALVPQARQLMAAATLRGGVGSVQSLVQIATRIGVQSGRDRIGALLHRIYQSPGSYVGPLEPDVLGEGLVARALARSDELPHGFIESVFADGDTIALRKAFTVLGRAAVVHEAPKQAIRTLLSERLGERAPLALEAAKEVGVRTARSPLGDLLTERLREGGDTALAKTLHAQLPKETASLRRLAVWLHDRLLTDATLDRSTRAELLRDASHALLDVAEPRIALARAEEAVVVSRELSGTDRDKNVLGSSLQALANAATAVGEHDKAVEAATETVRVFTDLVTRNRSFAMDQARAYDTLASAQSAAGRPVEALTTQRSAVGVLQALIEKREAVSLYDYAGTLTNYANRLEDAGDATEALKVSQAATALFAELAQGNPDGFLSILAGNLRNLSSRLHRCGQLAAAMETARSGIARYRELVAINRDAFLEELASSLGNYGALLIEAAEAKPFEFDEKCTKEALVVARESLDYFTELEQKNPSLFEHAVAGGLCNLSGILSALGQHDEAIRRVEEGLSRLRELARREPRVFRDTLATCLRSQVRVFHEAGRNNDARTAAIESAELFRSLDGEHPGAFRRDLAMSLIGLGTIEMLIARGAAVALREALAHAEEATKILENLASERGSALNYDRARSLSLLSDIHLVLGAKDRAAALKQEAKELLAAIAPGAEAYAERTIALEISAQPRPSRKWPTES